MVSNANAVMTANDMTGLLTPAAEAYLLQSKEITSKDYVDNSMLPNAPQMFKWAGITWMVHTGLPGVNTASERLFVFHRASLGFAVNREEMNVGAGYNDENDYYFARCSRFMGAVLLQNTGVCSIRHDGSAYTATA